MGGNDDGADVPELASGQWTPIAFRPRLASGPNTLSWISIEGAPIDAAAAHRLRQAGAIFMPNRHTREFVELVVRPAPTPEEARSTEQPLDNEGGRSP